MINFNILYLYFSKYELYYFAIKIYIRFKIDRLLLLENIFFHGYRALLQQIM